MTQQNKPIYVAERQSNKAKPTLYTAHRHGKNNRVRCHVLAPNGDAVASCARGFDDARLVCEALNVHHETGLTPRQLVEQRARLLLAAKHAQSGIATIRKASNLAETQHLVLQAIECECVQAIAAATCNKPLQVEGRE